MSIGGAHKYGNGPFLGAGFPPANHFYAAREKKRRRKKEWASLGKILQGERTWDTTSQGKEGEEGKKYWATAMEDLNDLEGKG